MLPKPIRRSLPAPADAARIVLEDAGPGDGPLLTTVAARLSRLAGQRVDASSWDFESLPPDLVLKFEVVDGSGRLLARGSDLEELRLSLADEMRAALARLAPGVVRHGVLTWDFGELPRQIDDPTVRAYPALVDEGVSVGVELFDSEAAQAASMWGGTRRLLLLSVPLSPPHLERRLTRDTRLAISRAGRGLGELLQDCSTAVADEVIVSHGGPAFDRAGFELMAAELRSGLDERVSRLATVAGGVLASAEGVLEGVDRLEKRQASQATAAAVDDVRRQVDRLVAPGFVSSAGARRLGDTLRYLKAAERRISRLPGDARRDAERQAVIDRVQARYDSMLEAVLAGKLPQRSAADLAKLRWSVEELRVSLWAQTLGTSETVSEERVMRALDELHAPVHPPS
jgi:ATP-dependent helicase HrpA